MTQDSDRLRPKTQNACAPKPKNTTRCRTPGLRLHPKRGGVPLGMNTHEGAKPQLVPRRSRMSQQGLVASKLSCDAILPRPRTQRRENKKLKEQRALDRLLTVAQFYARLVALVVAEESHRKRLDAKKTRPSVVRRPRGLPFKRSV